MVMFKHVNLIVLHKKISLINFYKFKMAAYAQKNNKVCSSQSV